MAVSSLKKTVFTSALIICVALPLAASAQSGIASVYGYGRTANGEHASGHEQDHHNHTCVVEKCPDKPNRHVAKQ